jgi:hypothetical protein
MIALDARLYEVARRGPIADDDVRRAVVRQAAPRLDISGWSAEHVRGAYELAISLRGRAG